MMGQWTKNRAKIFFPYQSSPFKFPQRGECRCESELEDGVLESLSQLSELNPRSMLGSPNGCISGSHPETARTSKSLPKSNNFTGKNPDKKLHLELGWEWMPEMVCLPIPLPERDYLCSPGHQHGPRLPPSLH